LHLAAIARERGDDASATTALGEAVRLYHDLGDPRRIAECTEQAAYLAWAMARMQRTARLLGAAAALRAEIGAPLQATERGVHDRIEVNVRVALGNGAFHTEWAAGRGLTRDRLVAEVVRDS